MTSQYNFTTFIFVAIIFNYSMINHIVFVVWLGVWFILFPWSYDKSYYPNSMIDHIAYDVCYSSSMFYLPPRYAWPRNDRKHLFYKPPWDLKKTQLTQ